MYAEIWLSLVFLIPFKTVLFIFLTFIICILILEIIFFFLISSFGHNNIICYPSAQNQSHIAFSENKVHVGPNHANVIS